MNQLNIEKYRFESDKDLPLDKALNVPNMIHCTKFEVFRKRLPTTTCRQLDIILKFLGKSETDNFTPCLIISDRFVHVFRNGFLQDNIMFSTRKISSAGGSP